jgi:hypothetical protein
LINVYVLYLALFFTVLNIYFHLLFILVHPQYIISYFVYFCPISVHYFIFWLILVHPKYIISSFVYLSPTPVHYHNQFFIEHEIRLYVSNALKSYLPFIDSRLLLQKLIVWQTVKIWQTFKSDTIHYFNH